MTIYFVAGEVSADNHGAALMRSLRVLDAELKFMGAAARKCSRSPAPNSGTGSLMQLSLGYGKC
ncbi:MAG: hypothetical protein DMF26_16265 [Verrucomicrobia bacterium]|nr:MAG: hypothetical protein DMF26_16265 [Verrucomicrobiota bacterium]